ncbi:hypothetical protein [Methylovulum psychrotolerans]|uniref:Uncharacterized protein n=1 Tax=Methylovulum psychrotolerans TaxID=1704499 RepID=A0A1Z4C4H8_9GAMM|nr:hypothetical protein [Methylovulum psychrotolerans]ASF48415.1 hypothetical protein CEK71_21420 [Methylovulum psychrotolerans]
MNQNFPDPNVKPFSLWSRPHYPKSVAELLADSDNLQQNLFDFLGCELFQCRDDIEAYLRLLVDDPQFRSKLGTMKRGSYDALASLDKAEQEIALAIAVNAMEYLIEQVSGILNDAPTLLEENYSLQYKLQARILSFDGKKYKVVAQKHLWGGAQCLLGRSFGRWLNMFHTRK